MPKVIISAIIIWAWLGFMVFNKSLANYRPLSEQIPSVKAFAAEGIKSDLSKIAFDKKIESKCTWWSCSNYSTAWSSSSSWGSSSYWWK